VCGWEWGWGRGVGMRVVWVCGCVKCARVYMQGRGLLQIASSVLVPAFRACSVLVCSFSNLCKFIAQR